ncbi:hypothetical protein HDK77DRAFT_100586 [Phyllosticta capitalensis]|uniref:uncharacterized protein n=1 Tax=Phyllosticta capitalensis TaxID=121624 RepID=UPI00312FC821
MLSFLCSCSAFLALINMSLLCDGCLVQPSLVVAFLARRPFKGCRTRDRNRGVVEKNQSIRLPKQAFCAGKGHP